MTMLEYPAAIQHAREQRINRACEMRRAGATYREIGAALGITRQRAHQLVNDAPQTKDGGKK